MTRGRWLGLLAALALTLVGARVAAGMVVEARWYAALGQGAADVWRARLVDLAALRLLGGTAAALLVFANLAGVARSVDVLVLPRRLGGVEIGESVPGRRLLGVAAVVAVVLGALLSLVLDAWSVVDPLRFGRSFGEIEPFTGHDLGFFVYWLPVENGAYAFSLLALVLAAALVVFLYALTPGLRFERGRLRTTRHVRRHLAVLGALLLLLLAWGHRLDAYALLQVGSGAAGARTALDELAGVPARFWLGVLTAVAALLVLRAGWTGHLRLAFWAVTGVLVTTFLARPLVPAIAGQLLPADELRARETAVARTRALVTQRAYAVDAVRLAPAGFGLDSLGALAERVAVWDPAVLARAVERARRGGSIGELGFQRLDGRLGAVLVERPPLAASEAVGAEWTVVEVDATRPGADGAPRPLDPRAPSLGEAGTARTLLVHPDAIGDVIVGDPDGEVRGDAIRGWGVRLAHALARRDLRLAFARTLDDLEAPEVVRRRDVRARVAALAPFFAQGHALTPLLAGDSLWWALPLYSASDAYPASQRYAVAGHERAYFQHAATALVNAQSGEVRLVTPPRLDAFARGWRSRFPRLFLSAEQLPEELAAALPPPADAVLVQTWAMAQFGSRRGVVPPELRMAGGEGGDSTLGVAARAPTAFPRLADDAGGVSALARERLGWTIPLLAGDRVAGLLVAVGGAAPATLWVPTPAAPDSVAWPDVREALGSVPLGVPSGDTVAALSLEPTVRAAPVDSTPAARRVAAPTLVRGRIRAVPVRDGVAWVQPAFAVARDGAPTLAAVRVLPPGARADADAVRAGASLAAAVLPAGAAPDDATPPGDRMGRARALYTTLRAALRAGDFAAFGRALDALGALLGATPPGAPR
jgi:uncharacterized membrane protein (UPF0182 family)